MTYAIVSTTASATIIQPLIKTAVFTKTTKADAVKFTDEAGIIPLSINIMANAASGVTNFASEGWSYCTMAVNGNTTSVTDTSISYATAVGNERPSGGYFIRNSSSGEIMYVETDSGYNSTSGNLVVVRGALGTTPATVNDTDYLEILNALHLYGEGTGKEIIVYLSLGKDPYANWF